MSNGGSSKAQNKSQEKDREKERLYKGIVKKIENNEKEYRKKCGLEKED